MDSSLMGLVGGFIAVAIMLGIGTLILGGAATDCTTVTGYNTTTPSAGERAGNHTAAEAPYSNTIGKQTGWSLQCLNNNTQSQSGYALLIIVLIVLAAVVVLTVVRMLA